MRKKSPSIAERFLADGLTAITYTAARVPRLGRLATDTVAGRITLIPYARSSTPVSEFPKFTEFFGDYRSFFLPPATRQAALFGIDMDRLREARARLKGCSDAEPKLVIARPLGNVVMAGVLPTQSTGDRSGTTYFAVDANSSFCAASALLLQNGQLNVSEDMCTDVRLVPMKDLPDSVPIYSSPWVS